MSCENNELSKNGPFQMHCCSGCDGFSLHLGAVTLRLDEQAVRNLTEMLKDGLARLDHNRQGAVQATLRTGLLFKKRSGSEPSS